MKLKCKLCQKDIQSDVSKFFNAFSVGRVTCHHCKKENMRYLSEADMLMYFIVVALIYALIFIGFVYVISYVDFIVWIVGIILVFIAMHHFTKFVCSEIYGKGYLKSLWIDKVQEEDADNVKRSLNKLFLLFMLIAFLATSQEYYQYFLPLILLLVGYAAIKLQRTLKREEKNNI
ncbi:MAG: hypothetical protein R3Y57_04340 [Erysipelotrichaceae bacterium]